MSLPSPIEMSLRQAVIGTFGVTYDGSDRDERSGPGAASDADRFGGWAADGRRRRRADGPRPSPGVSAASRVRGGRAGGAGVSQARPPEQSTAWRGLAAHG